MHAQLYEFLGHRCDSLRWYKRHTPAYFAALDARFAQKREDLRTLALTPIPTLTAASGAQDSQCRKRKADGELVHPHPNSNPTTTSGDGSGGAVGGASPAWVLEAVGEWLRAEKEKLQTAMFDIPDEAGRSSELDPGPPARTVVPRFVRWAHKLNASRLRCTVDRCRRLAAVGGACP